MQALDADSALSSSSGQQPELRSSASHSDHSLGSSAAPKGMALDPQCRTIAAEFETMLRQPLDLAQLEARVKAVFDDFQNQALDNSKQELDTLAAQCQAYLAQKPDEEGKPHQSYGGNPGNAYFQAFTRSVVLPSGIRFVQLMKALFQADLSEQKKAALVLAVQKALLAGWGTLRWKIAEVTHAKGKRPPFGMPTKEALSDPVHTYPGWYRLTMDTVRTELLKRYREVSANGDPVALTDPRLKQHIRSKKGDVEMSLYEVEEIHVGLPDAKFILGMFNPSELRFTYCVEMNCETLTEEVIQNLNPQVYCDHRRFNPWELHPITRSLLELETSDCEDQLSTSLFDLLKYAGTSSRYVRGQAAILMWQLHTWSQACGYEMKLPDSWVENGTRENLTADIRALSAFDYSKFELEWQKAVEFTPAQVPGSTQ